METQTKNFEYNLNDAENFGVSVQQKIASSTKQDYLNLTKTGEMQDNIMQPLMELKSEVNGMPKLDDQKSFFGIKIGASIVKRIEESKTKLTSVQSLLDKVESEANGHLENLKNNITDTTNFLDNTKVYMAEVEEHINLLNKKIEEVSNDSNPDKVAKEYYLQLLQSRNEELKGSLILVQQQRDQIASLRGASLVSSQKLRSTINIGIPLLSSQLSQNVMTMKLDNSNNTIDALTTALSDLAEANTQNWSKSMIKTAEQQKQGLIDVDSVMRNRKLIKETTDKLIEIQQTSSQDRQDKLERELVLALDSFHERAEDKITLGSQELSNLDSGESLPKIDKL